MLKKIFAGLGVTNQAEFWKLALQFFKFCAVGLSNTAVSMGCYYLALFINEDWYMLGSILGAILSIANAFFWNDRFVFKGERGTAKDILRRLGKTYVSYGGTSLLSTLLLWVEVNCFHVNKNIAPVVNLLVTIPLNFIINKLWTFRQPHKTEQQGVNNKNAPQDTQ